MSEESTIVSERLESAVLSQQFKRTGECKRCGQCCTMIGLFSKFLDKPLPLEIRKPIASMKCPHLRPPGGMSGGHYRCAIYASRPQFCRDYPVEPADRIDGCGFSFEETPEVKG